jgi:hypothetical protein
VFLILLSHILENLHLDINQIFIKNKELFSNVYFHFITDYHNSILFSQSYNEYILIKNYHKLIFLIINYLFSRFSRFFWFF